MKITWEIIDHMTNVDYSHESRQVDLITEENYQDYIGNFGITVLRLSVAQIQELLAGKKLHGVVEEYDVIITLDTD